MAIRFLFIFFLFSFESKAVFIAQNEGFPIRCEERGHYGLSIAYETESFPREKGAIVELARSKRGEKYSYQTYEITEIVMEDGQEKSFTLERVRLPVIFLKKDYFYPFRLQLYIDSELLISIKTQDSTTVPFVCRNI